MIHVSSPAATLNQNWLSATPHLIQIQKNKKINKEENTVQIPPADIPSASPTDCVRHGQNQYVPLGVKQPFDDRWGNSSHSDRFAHTILISQDPPPPTIPCLATLPTCCFFTHAVYCQSWLCMWLFEFNCKSVSLATSSHAPPNSTPGTVHFFLNKG